jgi:ABC-type glycerol-3-phosphate transport system permease component
MRIFVKRKRLNRSKGGDLAILLLLSIGGVFMALPMVYAICQAFKPLDELWIFPPRFFVRNPTLKNFSDLFWLMSTSWVPFSRYIFNTLFITIVGTAGHVVIASLCAYALAKHKFPGRKLIFRIIVLSLMFSPAVTNIPNYIIMARLGLVDNYGAIIIPAFAASIGLYLMKQFMEQFPDSILESARIDGSSEWRTFWQIVMPNERPAWLTMIIFSFQYLWSQGGAGTSANVFIYSEELKTLPVSINQIMDGGFARQGAGAAVAVFMMIVPVTTFIITQSNIIETMATSGMKE